MFGISMPEVILILAVALIVFGPKKLPELAKSLGRAISEFKNAARDFKESVEIDHELKDVEKTFHSMNDNIKEAIDIEGVYEKKEPRASAPIHDEENEPDRKGKGHKDL